MIGIGAGVGVSRPRGRDLAALIRAALFGSGEVGVMYDPSDLTSMFQDSAGTTAAVVGQPVGKILDKSGNGFHATQATSTARPVLARHPISGRRNLLTYTEDFGNAAWLKSAVTVTADAVAAPDGSMTADLITESATTSAKFINRPGTEFITGAVGTKHRISVYAKPASGVRYVQLYPKSALTRSAVGKYDLQNITAVSGGTGALASIEADTDGWMHCSLEYTIATAGSPCEIFVGIVDDFADAVQASYVGDGTSGVYLWGAQHELSTTSPTAYQKVTSTYDVTEAGVNDAYLFDGDGVDDAVTLADSGGGTTGFFLCAAVRPDGGAGAVRTIWSDAGTNTGYIVRMNASNQLEIAAGNGTAYTLAATADTLTVGTTYVVTAWDDGTNLNVQVNSGTAGTAARPVVSAGMATATIGKDNGAATGMFNGGIYPLIYVKNGENVDANDRAAVKTYIAGKAGVTL